MDLSFLGLHGWYVRHRDTGVLIDPCLRDRYGWSAPGWAGTGRRVELDTLGPVDAVVLTADGCDHVDLHSLHELDRGVPVLVPPAFPRVVADAVEMLGFAVPAATEHVVGDLTLRLGPPVVLGAGVEPSADGAVSVGGERVMLEPGERVAVRDGRCVPLPPSAAVAAGESELVEADDEPAHTDRGLRDAWHEVTAHLPVLARELLVSGVLPERRTWVAGGSPDWGSSPFHLRLDRGPAGVPYAWCLAVNRCRLVPVRAARVPEEAAPAGVVCGLPDLAGVLRGDVHAEELLATGRIQAWHAEFGAAHMAREFLRPYGAALRPELTWRYLNDVVHQLLAGRAYERITEQLNRAVSAR